jgi:hypothetical protein
MPLTGGRCLAAVDGEPKFVGVGFAEGEASAPRGRWEELTSFRRVTARAAVAAAIIPVGASAIWLALASDHVQRPVAAALYRSYLAVAPMLIGLYWWRRRPVSRFGPLLVAFGIVVWVVSWESSDGRWPMTSACWLRGRPPFSRSTFFWPFLAAGWRVSPTVF